MFDKMKQMMDMQKMAKEVEKRLDAIKVSRETAGGKIRLTLTGNQKIESLVLDESLLTPAQKGLLEKILVTLLNDTLADAKNESARVAMDLMKGLPG